MTEAVAWKRGLPGWRCVRSIGLVAFGFAFAGGAAARDESDGFTLVVATAMSRMMADMDIKPSGDPDRDFVAMMVPHHQGAIDMAVAELRFGKDERLKRIAQEIVVEQRQEIDAMRLVRNEPAYLQTAPRGSHRSPLEH
ncbi:DUF305 domain-containing protein [Sphingomonas glacialis]|uniref:DUF305 domain-containing protein n=1 Tax=Sphingomonas glacialis TaxID=658225 RepID=A0A502FU20_9SPHN|nr:DUF305 domain-containing protein [Sphingomonas glacialis]TPG53048.1 DUF305 domain-containing protein [Sphingomonas glacialis]